MKAELKQEYVHQLHNAFNALTSIRSVTSKNSKLKVLEDNSDNYLLKSILYLAYNPFLTFNVKKIPSYKTSRTMYPESIDNLSDFLKILIRLNSRELTGNAALDEISALFSKCSVSEQDWYSKIIQKDLKVGLAEKGINKAFTDLIPLYEILLAEKIEKEDLNLDTKRAYNLLPKRIICQYKIDGFRLNIFVYENEVIIKTRNGKLVIGYNELEKEAFKELLSGYVYDGEMVSVELEEQIMNNMNSGEITAPNRQLFSEAMSHAFSLEKNKKGVFNMFDMVSMEEWESKEFKETLEFRQNRIQSEYGDKNFESIKIVPITRVFYKENPEDLKEIVELFHYYLKIGWEGLMIKNYDSVYEFKRSKDLLKMKLMLSEDLEVVELYEGKPGSKYEGMMGGVVVEYKATDGNMYKVGVGSGWKDSERTMYWENPELIIGKTIEVVYQSESQNQNGGYSLSFPIKKRIREDK